MIGNHLVMLFKTKELFLLEIRLTIIANSLALWVKGSLWAADVVRNFCGHLEGDIETVSN